MPTVTFTSNLQRHVDCPTSEVVAETVGDALAAVFAKYPELRGYVVDDQGGLRQHVAVFVDGQAVADRRHLKTEVQPTSEVLVMQALSGG